MGRGTDSDSRRIEASFNSRLGFDESDSGMSTWKLSSSLQLTFSKFATSVPMRNLTLSTVQISILQADDVIQFSNPTSDDASAVLSAIAFDLDRNATFTGTESSQGVILIWRTSYSVPSTLGDGSFVFCGSYASPDVGIASLRVLSEFNQLVLVTLAGDIVVWELEESGDFVVSDQSVATLFLIVISGRC